MATPSAPAGHSHVIADQGAVFSFLADPQTHDLPPDEKVVRIDTHGAVVFLAGPLAYKVKRAVLFPFMDFSTLLKRHMACDAELRIGQINAPELYLDVVPLTQSSGMMALNGNGDVIEYAVRMRRFDTSCTLDQVVASGELPTPLISELAQVIAAAHARAEVQTDHDTAKSFASYISDNRAEFSAHPHLFPTDQAQTLCDAAQNALEELTPILQARTMSGHVRRCHGDLHLRNIVVLEGHPRLFDAIEFNDDIATCDILYDLAFLLMDVWERGLRHTANGIFNRYIRAHDDATNIDGIVALPFFLSMRASIRAKVEAAGLEHLSGNQKLAAQERIRRLFQMACAFLIPNRAENAVLEAGTPDFLPLPPASITTGEQRLIAIGGLSGSGKSTCAMAWAPYIGRAPGALVLRSDVERKLMFGIPETQTLPPEAYAPAITQKIYSRLLDLAARALASGQSVIVDAVHSRMAERNAVEELARHLGVPFSGIWLEAGLGVRLDRVEQRVGDASDANAEIARSQQAYDIGPLGTWQRLKTG